MFSGGVFLVKRGRGEGVTWEDLSTEEFIMMEENFHEGAAECSSIIKKNNEKKNVFFRWT